ncbi:MAG: twin-arginine translocase TatA/TatE family subunit [Bacteroidetes bacterium]|nr:twin-arginine translocase TatA/TatE family subunit [Bacteroidota bacterium]
MNTPLFILAGLLGGLGAPEIILIALVVLLLFGGTKIPELMKGIGKGVRGFKDGLKGVEEEINDPDKKEKNQEKSSDSSKPTPAG